MTTLITTINKKRHSAIDTQHNSEHCNTECQIKALYAECHPAECRYAECLGVQFLTYIQAVLSYGTLPKLKLDIPVASDGYFLK